MNPGPDAPRLAQLKVDEYAAHEARTVESRSLTRRALEVYPGGETRSAAYYRPYPVHMARAEGVDLHDVDGHRYLDFVFNYGATILGHAHPAVVAAAQRGIQSGISFSAPGGDHIELAEVLLARLKNSDRLRFVNSGTEANIIALRAARAHTGRDMVIKAIGGFHGTIPELDREVRGSHMPRGVPDSAVLAVPYNDVEALEHAAAECADRLAAVILETVLYSGGVIEASTDFLRAAQHSAHSRGALLILDEVATFRLAHNGHQSEVGLAPDITTLGKLIGGGFPVGALTGREDVMAVFDLGRSDAVPHSGTFNANPVTAAAGLEVMRHLKADAYGRLESTATQLEGGLQKAIERSGVVAQVTRVGSMVNLHFTAASLQDADSVLTASRDMAEAFHLGMLRRGVFCAPRGLFLTSLATEPWHVETAVAAADAVLARLADLQDG